MIDFTKPVQTRSGLPVRILCTDRQCEDLPVVGLVRRDGIDFVETWKINGSYENLPCHKLDLINVPQRHKHADVMIAYANDCSLEIEYKHDMDWHVVRTPSWNPNYEYRIKSR